MGDQQLVGSEIHGFHTLSDLDFEIMKEEAKTRWLRPNEIFAVLCNSNYFSINAKPLNLPKSGTLVMFDRKMLRNFRKDGHNWKKKKDGKTVKEAHEHLKVGNEERIHVYYAHGEDSPTFVRRCYWLLDKSLENIVLVHYRETREVSLMITHQLLIVLFKKGLLKKYLHYSNDLSMNYLIFDAVSHDLNRACGFLYKGSDDPFKFHICSELQTNEMPT